jgi:hypothetical protein
MKTEKFALEAGSAVIESALRIPKDIAAGIYRTMAWRRQDDD